MKEHRTKALRVTTTNAITSKKDDNNDLFGTLLQLELACLPSPGDLSTSTSSSSSSYCRLCHRRHHQYKPPDGASTVLQECSSCRNLPTFQFSDSDTFKFPLFASRASGLSPLHALFAGDTLDNWEDILEQVRLIVETPHWLSCTDGEGNTPLLAGGRKLLKLGEFTKAEELARILLDAGSRPDDSNAEGRTLLAYSVTHMDESIQLSRLLINAGASVWPNTVDAASEGSSTSAASTSSSTSSSALDIPTTPPPDSIFTSYLRAVMRKRKLDDACFETLSLIAQAMGEQPSRMHAHVMRTMFDHARCVRVLGPVFLQMKLSMSQHWCQPQSLQILCRTAFRSEAMRTKQKLNRESLQQLGLPLPLQKFVLYELTQ
ncbi:uncharacterized protein LOC103514389 [Diaphorina citri]|uniref:Uncharacterized protein LOC103514389 n=1 Tax=Diaphorina citri TaxID=121845 RepID=A0A1S3D9Y8_DIACI|nr:uncharacterized protein LOC103514389 [Diaphorina citri]